MSNKNKLESPAYFYCSKKTSYVVLYKCMEKYIMGGLL